MKRILLVFMAVLCLGQLAFSQQDPKFTHYMFNQVVYNPGFIGVENGDNFCLNFVHHRQWMGLTTDEDSKTAPVTTTFNFHRPIMIKGHKIGVGLMINNDQLGFMSDLWVHGGLNYIHQIGKKSEGKTLSGGLTFGLIQKAIDPKFVARDPNDVIVMELGQRASDMVFDMGIGFLYKSPTYYVGISTLHLPQSQFEWYSQTATAVEDVNRVGRHLYMNGGYNLAIGGNPDLVLQPRALLKWDRAKFQWDLGSLIEINQKYWGGLNFRGGEGIMFLAGFKAVDAKMEGWKFGVSYDLTLSNIGSVSNGTFELMANYCFPLNITPKNPEPDLIPRFLGGYTR